MKHRDEEYIVFGIEEANMREAVAREYLVTIALIDQQLQQKTSRQERRQAIAQPERLARESSSDSEEHDHGSEAEGRMQGPPDRAAQRLRR